MSNDILNKTKLKSNIDEIKNLLNEKGVDALYVSSADAYLNEYVPLSNCLRYYLSLFTGSTAELLALKTGEIKLYVDGRYHEQADIEVPSELITTVKASITDNLKDLVIKDALSSGAKVMGIIESRTDLNYYQSLKKKFSSIQSLKSEVEAILSPSLEGELNPIEELPLKYAGESIESKLKRIFSSSKEGVFTAVLDSVAWISNSRGYHLPCMSSFLGTSLVTSSKVYVFIEEGIEFKKQSDELEFISISESETLESKLKEIQSKLSLESLKFDPNSITVESYEAIKSAFSEDLLVEDTAGLLAVHSVKKEEEIELMKEAFDKADEAIYKTLKWVRENVAEGNKVSELDLYHKTNESYAAEGAKGQSFNTIAGVDANGSIIHYSDPKADVFIKPESMVLLDSGGYFESGYATDTTRTFMGDAKAKASDKHKLIYTLVLKGLLQLQNAVFKEGTLGAALDLLARKPLYDQGYDYGHGTGHGVGINVHEGGVRINSVSSLPMKEGQVVSIEPGIYIPGFGGVRLENIAFVKKHPKFEGFLTFESLTYIGFDPELTDESLLDDQEKIWLSEYEKECSQRKRVF